MCCGLLELVCFEEITIVIYQYQIILSFDLVCVCCIHGDFMFSPCTVSICNGDGSGILLFIAIVIKCLSLNRV